MKILLREYDSKEYVWVTAKYNGSKFVVNGRVVDEWQVVSIINDNRKNYIKCSCCGHIFPRKGNLFAKHKEVASTNAPCLKCRKLRHNDCGLTQTKYVMNDDGTYTMKTETKVDLYCQYSMWNSFYINSKEALDSCKLRQCGTAHANEIADTFTIWPGVFDTIITVDKILDYGYEKIGYSDSCITEYIMDSTLGITAYVNSLGIVDRFNISNRNVDRVVWYSKKYNILFSSDVCGCYEVWGSGPDNEYLQYIANLYK